MVNMFISVAEAARRAGVSELTIRRWIAADRLLAVRPAGLRRVLVREDSLAVLLQGSYRQERTGKSWPRHLSVAEDPLSSGS